MKKLLLACSVLFMSANISASHSQEWLCSSDKAGASAHVSTINGKTILRVKDGNKVTTYMEREGGNPDSKVFQEVEEGSENYEDGPKIKEGSYPKEAYILSEENRDFGYQVLGQNLSCVLSKD